MFKNNYKAWSISICLHVALIYFVSRQSIEVVRPLPHKAMQAYVMVELASMPNVKKITKINPIAFANEEQITPKNRQHSNEPVVQQQSEDSQLSRGVTAVAVKASTHKKPAVSNNSATLTKKEIVDTSKLKIKPSFKKLDPYTPIPVFTAPTKPTVSFGFTGTEAETEKSRITVPKEHSRALQSAILSQSVDSSKRVEMYQGKCYDIDFNTVFGRSGMPQGSSRPCTDNDALLLNKVMIKWAKKNK